MPRLTEIVMDVMQQLENTIRTVFADDTIRIDRLTTANDVPGWDSLSHVNLIVAVEMAFGIRFTDRELLTMRNVGDLADAIAVKATPGKR